QPADLANPDKIRTYMEAISGSAHDAAAVVSRLSEFYRTRESGEPLDQVDLNRAVTAVVDLTQPRWRDQALSEGRTIDVVTDLAEIPAMIGNEAELRELLTNLVLNA